MCVFILCPKFINNRGRVALFHVMGGQWGIPPTISMPPTDLKSMANLRSRKSYSAT